LKSFAHFRFYFTEILAEKYKKSLIRELKYFWFISMFFQETLFPSLDEIRGSNMTDQRLLNSKQASIYLCVSKAFLERDRWAGARIPFIKIGSRAVRYRLSDLNAYIEQQIRHSTSEVSVMGAN
jgi:predicted DNA-binding transcriptional regulator AlpA